MVTETPPTRLNLNACYAPASDDFAMALEPALTRGELLCRIRPVVPSPHLEWDSPQPAEVDVCPAELSKLMGDVEALCWGWGADRQRLTEVLSAASVAAVEALARTDLGAGLRGELLDPLHFVDRRRAEI